MLKYIFLFIFFFWLIRTVVRVLRRGVFFIRRGRCDRGEISRDSFSSGQHVEEADYEVLESHINHKKQEVD